MGMDAWFFARIDGQDRDRRFKTKNIEFISDPNSDAKCDKPIFTGLLYAHYDAPGGFGFDVG
jgi:hypothetical protein